MSITDEIKSQATALGFIAVGIATLESNRRADFLDWWLARDYGGTMRYLHRQAARRKEPATIVPGATRAVVVLDNYFPGWDPPADRGVRIAKYARGRDYHREL